MPMLPPSCPKRSTSWGAFNHHSWVLTLTEIAKASRLPKSTVHRLLANLIPMGVIEPHGNAFLVGIRLLPLVAAMPVKNMRDRSLPFLVKLNSWSRANVHFAVLRYPEIVLLEKFTAAGPTFPVGDIGVRMSAHTTALGKAMLAYLSSEELDELWPSKILKVPGHAPIDREEFWLNSEKFAPGEWRSSATSTSPAWETSPHL
jgi:DNA-binding IclR family transcriptional regulator